MKNTKYTLKKWGFGIFIVFNEKFNNSHINVT